MNRFFASTVFSLALAVIFNSVASAHCQVPCGIYDAQMRFERMLEDEHTISKAQIELGKLAGSTAAQDINQAIRWVTTKEEHASNIQSIIATYFMTQQIKTDDPAYGKKLMAAHKVMVMAMKAKQSADPATAKALEDSIFDFYRAFEGKEPAFDHQH
ncbi:Nickel-containing superoxide dismutase [Rubripirellula obstinata]|uniref:Nickel-containing superoxide dismutase n=1 Tax=Rubripirellula obstinata TaxID=406547 RepID=A0A5B1CPT9_9BACT|nr:superoxide dismutase [Ni] [Rubripirellula obstinata]KAA1261383.1 Nickel-containing superoxide dismutase [Rubripirellula obstinata]